MYDAQDTRAKELGAVKYYDEMIEARPVFYEPRPSRHFARYYFNREGLEIAYFIPSMLGIHESDDVHHDAKLGLHVHPKPRVWHESKDFTRLI